LERHWDREIHKPLTRNVSKARALGATLEALFLIAAFCRLDNSFSTSTATKCTAWDVGAQGYNLHSSLSTSCVKRYFHRLHVKMDYCCTAHKLKTVPLNIFLAVNCYMYYYNMSRINNQFSVGVHIMTALGDHHGEKVTSAHLTASVLAHDSQVRNVLSKLVKAGLVMTSRGRNGFSSLSRPANKISMLEIYKAVAAPPVFSIHEYPKEKTCRTSCTHKQAMVELLEDTQRAFETRLSQRMLSEMVAKARSYR
jgi:DNA-binding IscR family transcriptional regulator